MNIVRLRAYQIGPRGGRKLVASRIVSAKEMYDERRKWERELGAGYQVLIQDGAIRPNV